MNTKTKLACMGILAASATISTAALAEAGDTYLTGSIGVNSLKDADNKGSALSIKSEYNRGSAISAAAGYYLKDNVRMEGELSYRRNGADNLSVTNAGGTGLSGLGVDADGKVSSLSLMANAYYDFTTVSEKFVPYVMGGVGFTRMNADVSAGGTQMVDDSDTIFAYQIGAGAGYQLSEKAVLDVSYRYLGASDPDLKDSAGDKFTSEYKAHTAMVGVRYKF